MTEEINGIIYCLDEENLTAEVIEKTYNRYMGDIMIPEIVVFDELTYRVERIGDMAFYECYSLTSITIPNSVKSIGRSAFSYCESLSSITIPDSITSIGDDTFLDCESLTFITIPDGVTSIGDWAFAGCESLTSITIPKRVTSIGRNVFVRCSSLTSIVVEEGNTVYDSRKNCNAIIETRSNVLMYGCKTTIIPNSVEKIGYRAFAGCKSLTTIVVSDGVWLIDKQAFSDCESLTSITIPDSITIIGSCAFSDCESLTSITFQGTVAQWKNIESYCYRNFFTTFPFEVVHCTDGDVEI